MSIIAHHLAKKGLGTLVESIHERKPVTDPHIMMMAIGDIFHDRSPLQATQFEADIKIADQLQDLYLEGGGGGNHFESYDLPWAFAAHKTKIDCWDKRQKKGYLFTMGDELPPTTADAKTVKAAIGVNTQADTSASEYLQQAQERYEVFHLVIEEGHYARGQVERVTGAWRELLGKKVIPVSNYKYISEIITSIIEVNEGANPDEVINQWPNGDANNAVRHALYANTQQAAA